MDKSGKSGETSRGNEQEQARADAAKAASEVRLLNDLELVLASGGDGMPGWP